MAKPSPNPPADSQRGQTMAEFALVAPLLVLLFFGLTYAAFYGFRAAAADWGLFITGVAEGAYESPAAGQARLSVPWPDLRSALGSGPLAESTRQVRSQVSVVNSYPLAGWINLAEAHEGSTFFRLWRFYAGPPTGEFE